MKICVTFSTKLDIYFLANIYINLLLIVTFLLIRVAVVGNVDAGKSTLLGVLTHGELDNGRGMARQRLFRHKHEMESGRTSSVGNDILGFDSRGDVVNKPDTHGKQKNAFCIRLKSWFVWTSNCSCCKSVTVYQMAKL